jgi:hypothetical protein
MTGKFQMAAPGSPDVRSYLEWSGTHQCPPKLRNLKPC